MPLEEFGQHVPREHDDEHIERLYCKWEGRCPCANDCMKRAWPKLKPKLWGYGHWTEVIEKVHKHLTDSSYHMMTEIDAHRCIDEFVLRENPIVQYTEGFEEREAYRVWKHDVDSKMSQDVDVASALRMSTKHGRKQKTTQTLSDAIKVVEESTGDVDGRVMLEAVASMADAGDLMERPVVQHQRKRGSAQNASSSAEKRLKALITLDAEDLKSIGHVLVRARSDAKSMKIEAQNWIANATVLEENFKRHEVLINGCQDDLMNIIRHATIATNNANKAKRSIEM